jgi:hypothetical protein
MDRLNIEDPNLFDVELYRGNPGPYARRLLSYFIKILYPSKGFRELAALVGLNYGSVYNSYHTLKVTKNHYDDVKKDIEYISYRIGIRRAYNDRKLKKLLSDEVFASNNGPRIAQLIKQLTGMQLIESPGVNINHSLNK